jgi:hypothetical protein
VTSGSAAPPVVGSEIHLDSGQVAHVVIGPDQLHGDLPQTEMLSWSEPRDLAATELAVESVEAIRYDSMLNDYPGLGDKITTLAGDGFVVSCNLQDRTIGVRLHDGQSTVTISLAGGE